MLFVNGKELETQISMAKGSFERAKAVVQFQFLLPSARYTLDIFGIDLEIQHIDGT